MLSGKKSLLPKPRSVVLPLTCIIIYKIITFNIVLLLIIKRYDPEFKTTAAEVIKDKVVAHINNPYILGWYLDNEIHLGTNWWRNVTLFQEYLKSFPSTTYAFKATQAYVKRLYPTLKALKEAW